MFDEDIAKVKQQLGVVKDFEVKVALTRLLSILKSWKRSLRLKEKHD